MKFKKIDSQSPEFERVWALYESAFGKDIRRDLKSQKKILLRPEYNFYAIYDGEWLMGLLGEWAFDEFILIEHFAINKSFRGKGYGKKILEQYYKMKNCLVVREIERPKTEKEARDISFFQKLGAYLNIHNYIQPAYSGDKKAVPLFLMSYPRKITLAEFEKFRGKIHRTVYGYSEPVTKL
ncbi:MAG: GNAT family N-acetyltransferase [archaeon]